MDLNGTDPLDLLTDLRDEPALYELYIKLVLPEGAFLVPIYLGCSSILRSRFASQVLDDSYRRWLQEGVLDWWNQPQCEVRQRGACWGAVTCSLQDQTAPTHTHTDPHAHTHTHSLSLSRSLSLSL